MWPIRSSKRRVWPRSTTRWTRIAATWTPIRCCLATAIRLDLPAVTDDRAWMALDLGVKVLPFC
jgi:hypothetical protein